MKKKNVTIDELAMMVQNGFNEITSSMATKFNHLDSRMDRVEKDLKAINYKLTDIVYRSEFKELEDLLSFVTKKH